MSNVTKLKTKKLSPAAQAKVDWNATMARYGVVLEDATEPLAITIGKAERKGKPLDPGFCDFARGAKHIGAVETMFGNKVANIILRKGGKMRALRYVLPTNVQDAIRIKDNGGEVPLGTYVLMPPTGGRTLEAQKRMQKKASREWRNLSPAKKAEILAKREAKRRMKIGAMKSASKRSKGDNVVRHPTIFTRHFGGSQAVA